MRGIRAVRAVLLPMMVVATATTAIHADEPNQYPGSPLQIAPPLNQNRRELLTTVLSTSPDKPVKRKLLEQLCPFTVSQSDVKDESAQHALTVLENSVATEVLFEKPAPEGSAEVKRFSFLVDFSLSRVLLKHSTPRFPSEAAGLSAPFLVDQSRGAWVEGKLGSDIFVFIPPLRECGVQGVLLCPRSYEPQEKLVDSAFKPIAARFIVNAKADGLYSNPAGATGKVVASLQASKNVALPERWSVTTVNSKDPAATVKYSTPLGDPSKYPPFISMTLPWVAALRSRLDFGTEAAPLRTAFKEINVEITEFEMASIPKIRLGNSDFSVEGGRCTLVTQWGSSQL